MEDLAKGHGTSMDRPRRGWWSRNWLWFVPTALLGSALLCGGCFVGIFCAIIGVLTSSEPYQMALQRVQKDPQVIGSLGEPIEESGWFPTGEVNLQNDRGNARFDFDVAGPKGKAHVRTEARRIAGRWGLTRLEVTTENDQRITPDLSADKGLDEAPPFRR